MLRQVLFVLIALLLVACQTYQTVDQVENKTELNRYLQHISKKIEIIGAVRYPDLAKVVTRATKVEVEMRISKNGELLAASLLQSSNNPTLDEAVMDIIRYAAPHPPIPDELNVRALKFTKTWMFAPAE